MFQLIYSIFGYPLGWIMWLCYKVIPIYGVALLLFTIIVRLCLVPLSIKQQKSMVKMQIFQPRMLEIQKKYANNREKMNEELMKLYEQEHYNPMMGCLPMLIQMPILFGLYDVIQRPLTHLLRLSNEAITTATNIAATVLNQPNLANDYTRQIRIISAVKDNPAAFSEISDFVNQVQSLDLSIGPIDLTQQPTLAFNILLLIPILSLLTSLLVSLVTMRQTSQSMSDAGAAAAGMSKGMMLMMPLMSAYISFIVPAGLGVYWIISNLLMALQSYLLYKFMNPKELAEKARKEYEEKKEAERQAKIAAKKKAREEAAARGESEPNEIDQALSQKEINRLKLAAARRRDAEKYGETYKEVTDDDLK